MGVTKIKKTITCECGCKYGSDCGKKTVYLLWYYRGTGFGVLYENGVRIMDFDDHHLAGIIEVLTANGPIEELTPEENAIDPFK